MKVKSEPRKPVYDFKLSLTEEEAIKLCEEIGEWNQDKWGINFHSIHNLPKSVNAKLFMVLSDALQDVGLIPMTEGRNKGDKSRPRLENDEVEVKKR